MSNKIFITNSKEKISEEIYQSYHLIIYVCKDSAETTHYMIVKNRFGKRHDLPYGFTVLSILHDYLQIIPIENLYRTDIS